MVHLLRIFHVILYLKYFTIAIPFELDQTRDNVCYDKKTSAPIYCKTDFIDPISAFKLPIRVSENCDKSSRCGNNRSNGYRSRRRSCGTCNTNVDNTHSPRFLTDLHNENNATCWKSHPFPIIENRTRYQRNITLTLSLKKRYQLYFFAIIFCTKLPKTMIIYKSKDKGRNWIPYHYYSADCRSTFNIVPGTNTEHSGTAPCTETHTTLPSSDRIIINPNNSGRDMADYTTKEYEWASITDIKMEIVNPIYSRSRSGRNLIERSTPVYYGISDVSMGGRCQCNGHASACTIVRGKPACQCEHNTAGADCDRCKFFHFDRPWQRATKKNANPCVACNCNRHSTECEFDANLYRLSGNVSGGVCVKCRHNTAGRFCHECKNGYFKNHRDITYSKVCSPCKCNRVGSTLQICNRTTGQCPCKDHATGRRCQLCAPGYQQTTNPIAPCIKMLDTSPAVKPVNCPKRCQMSPEKQIEFRKYRKKKYVFKALVRKVIHEPSQVKYKITILKTWKRKTKRPKNISMYAVPCNCNKLQLRPGKNYLIFSTKPKTLKHNDSIVLWRDKYWKTMRKYYRQSKQT